MRKLIEFLLARADTHPEEFYEDRKSSTKQHWMHYVKQYKKFMTEEEYKAVWEKISAINLDYAMEQVTNKLLAPSDEVELHGFGYADHKVQGDAVAYTLQQRYQEEHLIARIEHQRQLMEQHVSIFDKAY
jgi:hypothetical protein